GVVAGPEEGGPAMGSDVGDELFGQRGLANAGLTDHRHNTTLAGQGSIEGALELQQLRVASYEHTSTKQVGWHRAAWISISRLRGESPALPQEGRESIDRALQLTVILGSAEAQLALRLGWLLALHIPQE